MNPIRHTRRALAVVGAAAVLAAAVVPAVAAPQEGVAATILMEHGGSGNEMTITAQGENLRMDMDSPRGSMSTIWLPDRMLMIMHDQKMYMEFDKAMLDRMRSMMRNMPNMPNADTSAPDPSAYTFERTGNTDTINGMSAFEVAMSGPGVQGESHLWMTEDADVGMFEVFSHMGQAMANMNMPFMNRGGGNPTAALSEYMDMAHAQGLPDGRVIRIVNSKDGDTTTVTLQSVEQGPIDASRFAAPAGYKKQQMPMMQR